MKGRDETSTEGQYTSPKGFDDYELQLGDILRGERATMGKSLLDVQRDIKIKASYVAAIEDGDLSAFETPGFIAGYVRSYGRYLGLDPDLVYQAFCEQSGFSHVEGLDARVYARERRPDGSSRPRTRKVHPVASPLSDAVLARNPLTRAPKAHPLGEIRPGAVASVAALLVLLGGLGYGAFSVLQSIQRVALAPADAPVVTLDVGPAATSEDDTAPEVITAGISQPSGDALMRLYRPQVLEAPVLVARDGPISTLDPNAQGAFAGAGHGSVSHGTEVASLSLELPNELDSYLPERQGPPAPQPPETDTVAVLAAPPPEVVLFTTDAVWLRIRAADGTVLMEKTMAAGEQYVLPQTEVAPTLRSGNSGALYFMVNGETLGPAGVAGSVTKNVELSVASLDERYVPVDLSTEPEVKRFAELVLSPEPQPGQTSPDGEPFP